MLRTLMIAAGTAVAAVVAVDLYRKIKGGGGGGDSDDSPHPTPAALPAAVPNQTFIPMPMMMPFPMPMGGGYGGGGYGMQPPPPTPPSRNGSRELSEKDEVDEMVKQVTRELRVKKAATAARRRQVEHLTEEFMEEE